MAIQTASFLSINDAADNTAGDISAGDLREILESCFGLPFTAKVANYQFVLADRGTMVHYNVVGTTGTFTIPTNATVAFDIGTLIAFRAINTGMLTIGGAGGVTVLSASASITTRARYSSGSIHKVATDTWYVDGDLL